MPVPAPASTNTSGVSPAGFFSSMLPKSGSKYPSSMSYSFRMACSSNTSPGAPKPNCVSPFTVRMRSATFSARSISWSDMMTVMFFLRAMRVRMVSRSSLWRTSRNDVGSSSSIISGCWAMARASSTRWRWPSLMALKSRSASSSAWTVSIASSTMRWSSPRSTPSRPVYGYRPVATTSRQVVSSTLMRSVRITASFLESSR